MPDINDVKEKAEGTSSVQNVWISRYNLGRIKIIEAFWEEVILPKENVYGNKAKEDIKTIVDIIKKGEEGVRYGETIFGPSKEKQDKSQE